jgi:hypothetical protein
VALLPKTFCVPVELAYGEVVDLNRAAGQRAHEDHLARGLVRRERVAHLLRFADTNLTHLR